MSASGSVRYATVGFATVYQYYAYPHHTRPRIAQVLILPPFQNIGLGAQLLRAIYADYIGRSEVKDITGKFRFILNKYVHKGACLKKCLIFIFRRRMMLNYTFTLLSLCSSPPPTPKKPEVSRVLHSPKSPVWPKYYPT